MAVNRGGLCQSRAHVTPPTYLVVDARNYPQTSEEVS
jgi:hypothetical protein